MIGAKRTLVSVLVAVALVGTAVTSMWLMASAGVFTGAEQPLPGAPERPGTTLGVEESRGPAVAAAAGFQSQPRNPFEPLVVQPVVETTTTTIGDESTTTTTGEGSTTTTTGGTTTTTVDDSPDGIRVVLLEVRSQSGVLVAVVEVEGETYTVRVGQTFAESFKVVSLTESGGVFTYGDSAFTLAVGQSIYK